MVHVQYVGRTNVCHVFTQVHSVTSVNVTGESRERTYLLKGVTAIWDIVNEVVGVRNFINGVDLGVKGETCQTH